MKSFTINTVASFLLLAACLAPAAARVPGAEDTPLPAAASLPAWPAPTVPEPPPGSPALRSRDLELIYSRTAFGGFVARVAGQTLARGLARPMIGYLAAGELRWLDLAQPAQQTFKLRARSNSLQASLQCVDPEGGRWEIEQCFRPDAIPGAIAIEVQVKVDQDRSVAFLPMLMVFPGAGTFGQTKGQGLFAGLEYLDNEPSSSEADVIGPASQRQVPDTVKITFPLMAIQNNGRYVALTWEMQPHFSAVFDSPDRLFGPGGHVMGLVFPGSDGKNRVEGSLLPRVSRLLPAGQPLVLRATLFGGAGSSVVPAVEQYVSLRRLPPLPDAKNMDLPRYVSLAAGGWLDSKIREGNRFRHAIGGNFATAPAAAAALLMDWLADHTPQPDLARRLRETAADALKPIAAPDLNVAHVGHVSYPVASLVYGHTEENAERAEQSGRQLRSRFAADGSVRYHPAAGGPDYGKTHFSNEASGLTSRAVLDLLEAAAFSGDHELLDAGLKYLRAMDTFRNGVPRGAQTWECPLHTPDILAAAHLVRAYTLGYELTGEGALLEQARYWAWTGVPFVYLVNPTPQPVGLYSTIAVFGATSWRAPVWMGLPVQWCGLVYADALYGLVRHDPKGPWKQIADGITLSGIQQTWPSEYLEQQGLLPDSFVLRAQHRNGPAINPATVQACAVRYFGHRPVYNFQSFHQNGLLVHAPGEISHAKEGQGSVRFEIVTGLEHPYFVLINGFRRQPQLRINGRTTACTAPHQYLEQKGRLILALEGKARIELRLKP